MSLNTKIAVIGLGYVGLPLAVALAKHFDVLGFDINESRVSEIQDGHDRTAEIDSETLKDSALRVTSTLEDLAGCSLYIVTVPTPVDGNNQPDLSPIRQASKSLGSFLRKGAIVVYESTVYPGVTEDICAPLLEQASGLKAGEDFFLGYSPERINPGDKLHTVESITKVVAGQTPEVAEKLKQVYGAINQGNIFVARSIKVAEAAKVIENAQRDINIAFVNEISMIFTKMGISTHDVLEAARTKWNFLPFSPGLVGGHCIGVDPYYLATCAQHNGHYPKVILSGRHINDYMGSYIGSVVDEHLHRQNNAVKKNRVLILGLAFKENVPDLRNTKVIDIVRYLKGAGHEIDVHDPLADSKEAKELYEISLVDLEDKGSHYDCIIGAVAHEGYEKMRPQEILELLKPQGLVVDIKNLWRDVTFPEGVTYWTL